MKKKTFILLPSRQEISDDIRQLKDTLKPEDILKILTRTYQIKGQARQDLRQLLKEIIPDVPKEKRSRPSSKTDSSLITFTITEITSDGEILGLPVKDSQDSTKPSLLRFSEENENIRRLQIGDQIITKADGKKLKFLRKVETPEFILGVFHTTVQGHYIVPTSRKIREEFYVSDENRHDAKEGDLVEVKPIPRTSHSTHPWAQVVRVLGSILDPKSMSLIAIHSYSLPTTFSDEALDLAHNAQSPVLEDREDLRSVPLVTIDDEDARDFDDAIWAEADSDPNNVGGWHLIVAIADVSHYVRSQDALDQEAFKRGNSVYFPDHVIPMLPEALSNELCSLKPREDRACLAAHLWINRTGKLLKHRFTRALMRSTERLTYSETQAARDGEPTRLSAAFIQDVISPLYAAYKSLCAGKIKREPLNLDLPEQRIYLDDQGKITRIVPRLRFDSHRLIEEFMIMANVAAAVQLSDKNFLCMYRVHDKPTYEKLEALREFLKGVEINLPKGQVPKPSLFNHIIEKAADTPYIHAVNTLVLRTQAQAIYSPDNIGHFGLSLARYAHFTSPIRRYADLLVHRALVASLKLSQGSEFSYAYEDFQEMGERISMTERRAAVAERETVDRYVSAYLSQDQGQVFQARIVGITDFAMFLRLAESGADGMIPMRLLRHDYFKHDTVHHRLVGQRTRQIYTLGDTLQVKLLKADPLKGSLIFEVVLGEKSNDLAAKKSKNLRFKKKKIEKRRKNKKTL
ncbi:MAG: ribonuclease R [Janthinobacterium lividum]